MKNNLCLIFVFALLLPSAIAFNCNSLSGGDLQVCNSIENNNNLSQTDKDLLISDIFNKNKTTPDFNFVYSWNTNLNIPNSPDGKVYSSGTIKNAWIKIISLMPSVLENNTLYCPSSGKLLTAYKSDYQLPSGTASGDCATYYYLTSRAEQLNVYVNNILIGHDKLLSFNNLNYGNINFVSELVVSLTYRIDHYRNNRYCRSYRNGRCTSYYYRCEFYRSEYKTDSLTIRDSLTAKLYQNTPISFFKITDKYNGITKGELYADNFTELKLSFINSEYQYDKYIYSLNYSLPYYSLTIRADKISNSKLRNIFVERQNNNFSFNVANSSNCKIQLNDFFNSRLYPCDLSFNQTNFSIRSDKINYFDNDTIKVSISPSDIIVNVSYGNESKLAKNYTEFKAVLYENKITGKLEDNEQVVLVNVNRKEDFDTLYQLCSLIFVIYICYKSSKSYLSNWRII